MNYQLVSSTLNRSSFFGTSPLAKASRHYKEVYIHFNNTIMPITLHPTRSISITPEERNQWSSTVAIAATPETRGQLQLYSTNCVQLTSEKDQLKNKSQLTEWHKYLSARIKALWHVRTTLIIRCLAARLTAQQHPRNKANATWLKAVINNSLASPANS